MTTSYVRQRTKPTCYSWCGRNSSYVREKHIHDLRHTFITMMVERGVPLGTVQAFVGHMSTRMLTHYTHISSGAARKAVELLDQDPILTETSVEAEGVTGQSARVQ